MDEPQVFFNLAFPIWVASCWAVIASRTALQNHYEGKESLVPATSLLGELRGRGMLIGWPTASELVRVLQAHGWRLISEAHIVDPVTGRAAQKEVAADDLAAVLRGMGLCLDGVPTAESIEEAAAKAQVRLVGVGSRIEVMKTLWGLATAFLLASLVALLVAFGSAVQVSVPQGAAADVVKLSQTARGIPAAASLLCSVIGVGLILSGGRVLDFRAAVRELALPR